MNKTIKNSVSSVLSVVKAFPTFVLLTLLYQTAALELGLSRDWGYGGPDGKIEGLFSMRAEGPEDLVEVTFYMDGEVVAVDSEAPFRYQFQTGDFPPGIHTMTASGTLASGAVLESRELVRNFLSAEEAGAETRAFLVPFLSVVSAVLVLGLGAPLFFSGRRKHKPGVYGLAGGAVCRRCAMPFSRSVLAPNMLTGKLERCPHCGKWQVVPRASAADLEAAEARLAGEGAIEGVVEETEEEKRRRLLDESRFDN